MVVTPVNVDEFINKLKESNYDAGEINFLEKGFREGFHIEYAGPTARTSTADNIPFTVGNKVILWNKIMKEVKNKRVAGPFFTSSLHKLHSVTYWSGAES